MDSLFEKIAPVASFCSKKNAMILPFNNHKSTVPTTHNLSLQS